MGAQQKVVLTEDDYKLVNEIKSYIDNHGYPYAKWYVGIASDAVARLFTDHSVTRHPGVWIYRRASSSDAARVIEKFFLDNFKTKGGLGGGDDSTMFVYAYLITQTTIE